MAPEFNAVRQRLSTSQSELDRLTVQLLDAARDDVTRSRVLMLYEEIYWPTAYLEAGCPHGPTLDGLNRWKSKQEARVRRSTGKRR